MLFHRPVRKSWMRLDAHSWLRYCLVWVLCVCAWRGPVPVLHCHCEDDLATASDTQTDWQLVQHLAVCHAGESGHGDDLGWHIHFVSPSPTDGSEAPHELPLDNPVLAELITHATDGQVDVPANPQSINVLADIVSPFHQPALAPQTPKLIPLAPPRHRPSRVSPRIYYCVVQC